MYPFLKAHRAYEMVRAIDSLTRVNPESKTVDVTYRINRCTERAKKLKEHKH